MLTGIRTSFLFHSQTSSALDFRGLGGCAGPRAGWEGLDCDPRDKINSAHVPSATVEISDLSVAGTAVLKQKTSQQEI